MPTTKPGQTVLVTGATGFVGGAVTANLLASGYQVIGLAHTPGRAAELGRTGARVVRADMRSPATFESLVSRADAVVHAAQLNTRMPVTTRRLRRMARADEVMTTALARECASQGKRLLYTSGCFIYGDHRGDWITERTPLNPSPLGRHHAAHVGMLQRHSPRLDVVIACLGFVYGPGGTFKAAFYDMARKKRMRCIGSGGNYWSCIHLADAASGFRAVLERGNPGELYNLSDDRPLPLRDFVDRICAAMSISEAKSLPPAIAGLVTGRPVVASLTTSYRVSNAKARDQLGWCPTYPTVADGLPPTLAILDAAHNTGLPVH